MNWRKLGKIFDPTNYKLPNGCFDFAQSPQALVYDNFVRIYFSTRQKDEVGKYLSHVAFVDMDKNFSSIINVSTDTVIKLGNLGCFDEHGIFPINPVRDDDRIIAYTCGWSRRASVSIETAIGLVVSHDDGLTFERIGEGPVLASSINEPFLVGDGFVRKFVGVYHMWYIYGVRWIDTKKEEGPARVYKIAHATSKDGVVWQKEGREIISNKLDIDECQALPTVIERGGKYHMFFCYRHATDFRKNKDRGYKIGYAFSKDLINWTRDDDNVGITVSAEGWDSDMMCYPNVFECEGKVYMLYNGNEFGRLGFGLAVLED